MATNFFTKIFGSRNDRLLKQYRKVVVRINAIEPEYEKLSDEQLRQKTQEFKDRIAGGESLDDILPEAFAVACSRCGACGGRAACSSPGAGGGAAACGPPQTCAQADFG